MSDEYKGLETFINGLGTVRECVDCACLVAGGPTRCIACANGVKHRHKKLMFFFFDFLGIIFIGLVTMVLTIYMLKNVIVISKIG